MSKNEKKVKTSCFVTTIDLALADKLKHDLSQMDFAFTKPQYTIFSAQKKGISISLYESGKLMVQGKEMGEFIEYYLEPEIIKNFTFSHPEEYIEKKPHMGSDEAGKGDFFGPLCIACVYADTDGILKLLKMGVKDNKKLSDKKTLEFAKQIKEQFAHHIIKISPIKYNELYQKFSNLNSLLAWAHAAAIENLFKQTKCPDVIVDQFASKTLISRAILSKEKSIELTLRPRAEEDVVVAAAAILARSTFLYGMTQLSEELGIELPKGASTITQTTAIKIVKQFGKDELEKYCKKHFKTYQEVLDQC